MNFISMLSMRVEPPKPGVGRVHRLQDTIERSVKPRKPPKTSATGNNARREASEARVIAVCTKPRRLFEIQQLSGLGRASLPDVVRRLVKAGKLRQRNGKFRTYVAVEGACQ